jgi:pilus assembly protein CpaE
MIGAAMPEPTIKIVFISPDAQLGESMRATLASARRVELSVVDVDVESAAEQVKPLEGDVLVIDVDANRRAQLVALQKIMTSLGGRTPVIVLTDGFDDAVGRWFLQIRITDFMKKPVRPEEVLQACLKALVKEGAERGRSAQTFSFVQAAGGVGNTTIALEAALQILQSSDIERRSTCLIDLDFHNDACAEFLDIEPRLDLKEIGARGERLDAQLLQVLLSHHSSGLALLAASGLNGEVCGVDRAAVIQLLEVASSCFANLVVDLPRTWQPWADDVLVGSDRIYVVTDMTVPGLRCGRKLASRVAERLPAAPAPQVIVNRFEPRVLFGSGLRRNDVERALDGCFAGGVANNYPLVREAIDRGVSLEAVKAGNNVSADVKRILFARAS